MLLPSDGGSCRAPSMPPVLVVFDRRPAPAPNTSAYTVLVRFGVMHEHCVYIYGNGVRERVWRGVELGASVKAHRTLIAISY